MKQKIRMFAVVLALLLSCTAGHALAYCSDQYAQATKPVIENVRLRSSVRDLCFSQIAVAHSGVSKTALWSAEHLTPERLRAASRMKRENAFHEETALPASERSELSDYSRSGYDRGHLSPSADQPDANSQYESFSLANMVPQDPNNNRNLWEGIEHSTRELVFANGDLYVVTGPVLQGDRVKKIGAGVLVPTLLYKAVYDPRRHAAAAYIVENTATSEYKVISIAQLEKIAGINPFPFLGDDAMHRAMDLPAPTPHGERSKQAKSSNDHTPMGDPEKLMRSARSITRMGHRFGFF